MLWFRTEKYNNMLCHDANIFTQICDIFQKRHKKFTTFRCCLKLVDLHKALLYWIVRLISNKIARNLEKFILWKQVSHANKNIFRVSTE